MDWDFYVQKRDIIIHDMIQKNKIDSYNTLCNFLKPKGVKPPSRSQVAQWEWFLKVTPAVKTGPAPSSLVPVVGNPDVTDPPEKDRPKTKKPPNWKRKKTAKKA